MQQCRKHDHRAFLACTVICIVYPTCIRLSTHVTGYVHVHSAHIQTDIHSGTSYLDTNGMEVSLLVRCPYQIACKGYDLGDGILLREVSFLERCPS